MSCKNNRGPDYENKLLTANEITHLQQHFRDLYEQLKIDSSGFCIFTLSGDNVFCVDTCPVPNYSLTTEWLKTICKFRRISKIYYTQLLNHPYFKMSTKNKCIYINCLNQQSICKSCDLLKSKNIKKSSEESITIGKNDFIELFRAEHNDISIAIENVYKANIIKNLLEKSRCIEGWHIQQSHGMLIYWNLIKIPGNTILSIILPQLKLGIIQNSKRFDWDKFGLTIEEDITYNPFIAQIIETLVPKQITNPAVVKKVISDLKTKEIIGINRATKPGNEFRNTDDSLIRNVLPIVSINYVPDNYCGKREFFLDKDTKLRIIAVGEGNSKVNHDKDLDREHIEFFFDMNNDRIGPVDARDFDSQYRISVFDSSIYGTYNSTKGIQFKYKPESKNLYHVKILIPWNILGYIHPAKNVIFGFDMGVSDNDESGRENKIMWHATNDSSYINTSLLGQIKLVSRHSGAISDSLLESTYTNADPFIDDNEDRCWENVPLNTIKHVTVGTLDNNNDIKATFKSLWNNRGMFFLVTISDDEIIKNSNILSYCHDFGWIENENTGEKEWKMRRLNCRHIGNEKINIYSDTVIILKKGKYNLFYSSDNSHSYMKWFDNKDYLPFYGIKVLKQK